MTRLPPSCRFFLAHRALSGRANQYCAHRVGRAKAAIARFARQAGVERRHHRGTVLSQFDDRALFAQELTIDKVDSASLNAHWVNRRVKCTGRPFSCW
jgi:hypothetical protein